MGKSILLLHTFTDSCPPYLTRILGSWTTSRLVPVTTRGVCPLEPDEEKKHGQFYTLKRKLTSSMFSTFETRSQFNSQTRH